MPDRAPGQGKGRRVAGRAPDPAVEVREAGCLEGRRGECLKRPGHRARGWGGAGAALAVYAQGCRDCCAGASDHAPPFPGLRRRIREARRRRNRRTGHDRAASALAETERASRGSLAGRVALHSSRDPGGGIRAVLKVRLDKDFRNDQEKNTPELGLKSPKTGVASRVFPQKFFARRMLSPPRRLPGLLRACPRGAMAESWNAAEGKPATTGSASGPAPVER